MPPATRTWTVERPSYGLALAFLGALIAALGLFVLDWDDGTGFLAWRHDIDFVNGGFSVLSEVYTRTLYLPVFLAAVLTGLSATASRTIARVGSGAGGLALGGWLIGTLIWVETGAVGTSDSRSDALPLLVFVALVGVGCLVLGGGAFVDDAGTLARTLATVVAALAIVLHVYAIEDLLDPPGLGAWVPVIGFGLLAVAPVLPYRRIERTAA